MSASLDPTDLPFLPPPAKRRRGLTMKEDAIQRAVFKHLKRRGVPGLFAFHPKNGGVHQAGRRRAINAGLGVVTGVPDIIIIHRASIYALELKSDLGRASPEQIDTMQRMQSAGAIVALTCGLNNALRKLEDWGLIKGEAT